MKWLLAFALVACRHPASVSAPDASAPIELPALPLADFSVSFEESAQVAGGGYFLDLAPDHTLTCTHGTKTKTKVSDFELEPLETIVRTREFAAAAKPSGFETGDVPTFHIRVASKTVNVESRGYVTSSREYTTPAPMKSAIAELEKLCTIAAAPSVSPFSVVYERIEQGGTAGKRETFEVRSEKYDPIEIAPLSRLLMRPELAALGPSFTDSSPRIPENDYVISISKPQKLSGTFYEKTPPIVSAIAAETFRVASLPKTR